jgi:hypothetical protein
VELIGLYLVAAGLLVVAGSAKALRPDDTARALSDLVRARRHRAPSQHQMRTLVRVVAIVELVLGSIALAFPRPATAGLVALSYALFGCIVVFARRRGGALSSCGCFGRADTPATTLHALIDFLLAASCGAVALGASSGGSLVTLLGRQPAHGLPLVFVSLVGLYMAYLTLSLLSALEGARRLVRSPTTLSTSASAP